MNKKLKILSLIKPYDRAVQTNGALWVGVYLSNQLVNRSEIQEVGVLTKLNDYSVFDNSIKLYKMNEITRSVNKDILQEAIRIYKEEGYDVIHAHVNSLSSIKWFVKLIPDDINFVYTLHNPSMLGRSKIVYGEPYGSLLNDKPNFRLVAVSNFNGDVWKEFTGTHRSEVKNKVITNLSTIYNGIIEYPDLKLVPIEERERKVCVCSRITPVKNSLKVIQMLHDYKIPSIYIGSSYYIDKNRSMETDDEYAKECIDLLKDSPNIEWKHDIPNKEVLRTISKCIATVHLPVTEGFALVPLESMYVGTPVIYSSLCEPMVEQMGQTSDLRSIGDKVELKSGSRQTTRARIISEHIKEFLDNPRDPKVVHDYYMNNFSLKLMVDKYVKLYQSFK